MVLFRHLNSGKLLAVKEKSYGQTDLLEGIDQTSEGKAPKSHRSSKKHGHDHEEAKKDAEEFNLVLSDNLGASEINDKIDRISRREFENR